MTLLLATALAGYVSPTGSAPLKPNQYRAENDLVRIRLTARTPDQIRAFYEARGFPPDALKELAQTCFITIGILNKSRRVVWHKLDHWIFYSNGEELTRFRRKHWNQRWQALAVRAGLRATFRWTLLPEELDFQPDEGEGGNIILPRVRTPITIKAVFYKETIAAQNAVNLHIGDIRCAVDP